MSKAEWVDSEVVSLAWLEWRWYRWRDWRWARLRHRYWAWRRKHQGQEVARLLKEQREAIDQCRREGRPIDPSARFYERLLSGDMVIEEKEPR